jgi:hypothetical protein
VEIDVVDQPTKSVTFSLTKATVIREIKDVQLQVSKKFVYHFHL